MQRIKSNIICLLAALLIIILDQVSKYFALRSRDYTLNEGALFGLPLNFNLIILFSALLLALAFYFLVKEKRIIQKIALTAISAGLLLNILDRIIYKGAIDFINLGIIPLFNIADMAVTLGAISLVIALLINHGGKS